MDRALARRLEGAQAWRAVCYTRARQQLRPEIPCRVEKVGTGYAVYAGPDAPLNKLTGLGMDGPVTERELEQIESFFWGLRAPARITLCPLSHPTLLSLLQARGYRPDQWFNVLLATLATEKRPALPARVQVEQVGSERAKLWLETVIAGFGEEGSPVLHELLAPNFFAENGVCYLAWLDGQPAGGGAFYHHEGVAEFGGASTRPRFRRQGVQSALLAVRMAAAQALGCGLGLVVTSPGTPSQRNVERAGFRLAYSTLVLVKHEE